MKKSILSITILSALIMASSACASTKSEKAEDFSRPEAEPLWTMDQGLANPESVVFDPQDQVLYVTNVNQAPGAHDGNGYISKVSADGELLEAQWMIGFDAPKGTVIYNRSLFVTDINRLVEIDLDSAAVINEYPFAEGRFLNDVTVDAQGTVYVTDTGANRIYALKDGNLSMILEDALLSNPNGIFADNQNIVVVSWTPVDGEEAPLSSFKTLNTDGSNFNLAGESLGYMDGICPYGPNFIVSDYVGGKIFYVNPDFEAVEILTLSQGSADIFVDQANRILYVPMMETNTLLAYTLK